VTNTGGLLGVSRCNGATWDPVVADKVLMPARKVFLHDNWYYYHPYGTTPAAGRQLWTGAAGDDDPTNSANYSQWYWKPRIGTWHDGRTNFAFMDGHQELVPWSSPMSFGDGTFEDYDTTYWKPYD